MSDERHLSVVLCWHMHQPQYRDHINDDYQLPWTYLHGIKDYADMAYFLETVPNARAVVNFAPILLEQLEDYAHQARVGHNREFRDPLLAALVSPDCLAGSPEYLELIKACLCVNRERVIHRFAPYRRLADIAAWHLDRPETAFYLGQQYLADMLVWYHLGWMGETVRRQDTRIRHLMEKGQGFTESDRHALLDVIGELLTSLIARYRALHESGRVELSMTPYAHPMLPLLLDFESARDAMPEVRLPWQTASLHTNKLNKSISHIDDHKPLHAERCIDPHDYPGGLERSRWHIDAGKAVFQRCFGFEPRGCWPSEGGVSLDTLHLLDETGFIWAASGEAVLHNSLHRAGMLNGVSHNDWLYQPYQVDSTNVACFFRDDGLSDLIGFNYKDWHADDAINNLIHHLENIANSRTDHADSLVSIIMDGENAWEYFPENAYHFLGALYKKLGAHPHLNLTTFSDYLRNQQGAPAPLPKLTAGSWVYGSFSTWIGDSAKNRGWEMLCEAKCTFDAVIESDRLRGDALNAAERQLAVCEGSDWFWWFGDYNPAATVSDFERLFRLHLANLYCLLGEPPPAYLSEVVSEGSGAPALGGVMRPGMEHH